MHDAFTGIGAFLSIIVLLFGFLILVLSILMPFFIYFINSRVKQLLQEIKKTNALLAEFLKRLDSGH